MGKFYSLLLILFIFHGLGKSQAIVSTTHTSNNGQNGITFNVKNTTKDTITITEVATVYNATNGTAAANLEVWYRKGAINGTPPLPIATASGWIMAGSRSFVGTSSTTPSEVGCINIKIPKDSTYGFWIGGATTADPAIGYMTLAAGVNTFTTNGVSILTGTNIGYGGSKTGLPNTPRGFVGYVKFFINDSCSGKPSAGLITGPNTFCGPVVHCHSLTNTGLTSKGMTYQWYSSPNASGPFSLLTTGFTQSATMTANQFYKSVATCAYSGLSDTTPVFSDTLGYQSCFCPSIASSTADTKIDTVIFLNKVFGTNPTICETYTDNTFAPQAVKKKDTFSIYVKNGSCSNSFFSAFGACYIDWNKNRVFDPSELIGSYSSPAQKVDTLKYFATVPASAASGYVMMRILHYEDLPITSGCYSYTWGETEDFMLYIRPKTDLKMVEIGNKSACEKSSESINFTVTNTGSDTIVNPSFSYSVNGSAPITESFTSNIYLDSSKSFTFTSSISFPTYGKYTIKVWSNNPLDSVKSNDTILMDIYNYKTPTPPLAKNDTVCLNNPLVNLTSTSTVPFKTRWYLDTISELSINEGDTFAIFYPTVSKTYYTRSVNTTSLNVGLPFPNGINTITTNDEGIIFDVLSKDLRINTVDVYFTVTGNAVVEILDKTGNSVFSKSFVIASVGKNILSLNASLSKDTNYQIVLSFNPGGVLYTNNYAGFPLNYSSLINIKKSTSPNNYSVFYNWNISAVVCASSYVPVFLKVYNIALTANLNNTYSACEYPGLNLDAGNVGCTYKWSTNETTKVINVPSSGLYKVTVTNSVGCKVIDSTNVTINPPLSFALLPSISGCFGDSTMVASGFSNDGYSHRWSTKFKNPYSHDPTIYPQESGKYYLTVLNTTTNCGGVDSVDVTIYPKPVVNLGLDTSSCNSKPIKIYAPFNPNYTYKWQDGSTNSSFTASNTQKVWVQITDNGTLGCKSADTVDVTISTLTKPNLGVDQVSCGNFVSLGVPSVNNVVYQWNNGASGSFTDATITGQYILKIIENGTRCSFSDTVNVSFLPGQTLNLGPDVASCGKPITLYADAGWKTYKWSNGFTSSSIVVNASGSYEVTATNDCGTAKDTINVSISQPTSVSLPEDTTVCKPISVSISSQASTDSIKWSTGDVNVTSITISQPGNYWVSVKNGCGTYSDAINVKWDSVPTADFTPTINGKFVSFKNLSTNGKSYYWDFGDYKNYSTYSNAANFYDSVKQYSVKLTVKNGCGDSTSITKIIVTDSTLRTSPGSSGILLTSIDGLSVYPNPAKSSIYINSNHKPITHVELFDLSGKKILELKDKIPNSKSLQINLESFSSGHYILKISSDESYQIEKIEIIK